MSVELKYVIVARSDAVAFVRIEPWGVVVRGVLKRVTDQALDAG